MEHRQSNNLLLQSMSIGNNISQSDARNFFMYIINSVFEPLEFRVSHSRYLVHPAIPLLLPNFHAPQLAPVKRSTSALVRINYLLPFPKDIA